MTRKSDEYFARARAVSPGGVHSPVRAFRHVDGQPLFMRSASGCQLRDVDGREYTDYCMAFGPMILGHRNPAVASAVSAAIEDGWSFGTAETWSLELAELLCGKIDWIDQVRFVNSGTEAVMSALRLARGATGRNKLLKFAGCYHGHVDSMLIEAGSGLASQPSSAGISAGSAQETLVVALNDAAGLERAFAEHGTDIAAVILEPLPANHGLLPQTHEFLQGVADISRRHGSLLIFDEVITGFRIGFTGITGQLGIEPDIVTWGKIIGGGFPVGAFAARRELMRQVAPEGGVYQAGTLSANPMAMRAGLATVQQLTDGLYAQLEARGQQLETAIAPLEGMRLVRNGSIFWICMAAPDTGPIRTRDALPAMHVDRYPKLFRHLLDHGIYFPPSPYEVAFLSAAHLPKNIEKLQAALASFSLN